MKDECPARMVHINFGEDDRWQGKPLHEAILARCKELGIAEVIVFRGIQGYGPSTRIHRSSHWSFSKDAPVQMTIIDSEAQIALLLPALDEMVAEGLVAASTVQAVRYSRTPEQAAAKS